MNTQDLSPLGWTGWISLQSKGLSNLLQHHSSKTHPNNATGKNIVLTRWTFVGKVMSLLFNVLSRLVIAFLPMSKHLLISWLQSPSAVILKPPKIKSVTVSTVSPVKRITAHNECLLEPGIFLNPLNLLICLILTMAHHPNFPEGKLRWVE